MSTEPAPLALRQATPKDAPVIAAITAAAYEKYVVRLGRQPQPMTADYAAMAAEHAIWLLCAGPHEQPLGLLILQHAPDAMLIYSVAIHPDHQRQGLGKQLLKLAETKAHEAGYTTIRLYTNEHMNENIAMYQRLGYQETHREPYKGTMTVHMAKAVPS